MSVKLVMSSSGNIVTLACLLVIHCLYICVQSGTQNCQGSYSCTASIYCFSTEPCIIDCDGDFDTSYGTCRTAQVEIQTATDLTVNCYKFSDCRDMTVQCGTGDCTVNCGIDAGYSDYCNGMNIICGPGLCNINCNQNGVNTCADVTMDIALASSYSCVGDDCGGVTFIGDTPSVTTYNPTTYNPTYNPTTYNPTTYNPTTASPTTTNPTTANPTTAQPTTNQPTTSMPTYNPSTSPITFIPTTSAPMYNPTTAPLSSMPTRAHITPVTTTIPTTMSTINSTVSMTTNPTVTLATIAIFEVNIAEIDDENITITEIIDSITIIINDEITKLSVANTDYVLDFDVIDNTIIVNLMATQTTLLNKDEINNIKGATQNILNAQYGNGIIITEMIVNEYASTMNTNDVQGTNDENNSNLLNLEPYALMIAGTAVVLCIGLLVVVFIWKMYNKKKAKFNDKLSNVTLTNIELNRISSMTSIGSTEMISNMNTSIMSISKSSSMEKHKHSDDQRKRNEEIDTTQPGSPHANYTTGNNNTDDEEMYTNVSTPRMTAGANITPRGNVTPGNVTRGNGTPGEL